MERYKDLNINPRYVFQRMEINFQQYQKYVPYSCLISDMEYALVGQVQERQRNHDAESEGH